MTTPISAMKAMAIAAIDRAKVPDRNTRTSSSGLPPRRPRASWRHVKAATPTAPSASIARPTARVAGAPTSDRP
jgi:hypothetical protein